MGNITETSWFEEQLENMEEDFPFLNGIDLTDEVSTEIDLGRDVPTYEDWVEGHIGEPEYLGDR